MVMQKESYFKKKDLDKLFYELRKALSEEIEYIKERNGETYIYAKNGRIIESRGKNFIYSFIMNSPTSIPDDSPIEVKVDERITKGYIVAIEGLKLTVILEKDIGEIISEATIIANSYYLLKIMEKRLSQVVEKEISINQDISQKVFGLIKSRSRNVKDFVIHDYLIDKKTSKKLNEEQKNALSKSVGSEVTFIWGPPGTGKTFTLAKIAEYFFQNNLEILVLSHTNIAVDNAIEKIAENLEGNEDYLSGKVIRYGYPQMEDLFDRMKEISLDYWVELESKPLIEEKNNLENKIYKINLELDEINKLSEISNLVSEQKKKIKRSETQLIEAQKIVESIKKNIDKKVKDVKKINERLNKVKGTLSRFFYRLFYGISTEKLKLEKKEISLQIGELRTQIEKKFSEIKIYQKIVNDEKRKLENLYSQYKNVVKSKEVLKEEELNNNIPLLEKERKNCVNRVKEIEKELSKIAERILKKARLIATTLTKGYIDENIFLRNFNVVIVDEASIASMPMLFFDSGLAVKKVIIIGDFRQLAPIAQAKTNLVNKWLKRDIFEQVGIIKNVDLEKQDERLACLLEQHRMRPEISKIPNRFIYKEKLRDSEKKPHEKHIEEHTIKAHPFPNDVVIICDTSKFDPWCAVTDDFSRFNIYSASLAIHLAKQALNNDVEEIGIITPYAAQSKILARMIWDEGLEEKLSDVSSVHRFQGREKELIIFDLAEGPGSRVSRLLRGKFGSDAMRLLNVATTRARSKLIFIANLDYLIKKVREDTILRMFLEYMMKKHRVINSSNIFEFLRITNKSFKEEKDLYIKDGGMIFYTQELFYDQLFKDFSKCKQELIIFSPFIIKKRINDIEKHLIRLVKEGVKVIIFTRPISKEESYFDEGKKEAVEYLRKAGIDVIFKYGRFGKYGMNEKLIIIDGNIIWQGNINILSHKNTDKSMGRWVGQYTAQEILRLLRVQRADREAQFRMRTEGIKYGKCPKCGEKMVIKKSRYGPFLACSKGYKVCKGTKSLDEIIIEKIYGEDFMKCEKCGGEMKLIDIPGKKAFLGCSNYPDCRFTRSLI